MSTLSPANTNSLKQLGACDEATANKIVEETFNALTNTKHQQKLNEKEAQAQVGLATLISVFARQGSQADSLTPVLRDSGISNGVITKVADLYKKNVDLIRAELANLSFTYPRVTGCEWRLDYSVSNSETGPVYLPNFFVKILLEGGNSIDFSCNEEEMTALVAALKDASQEAARTH
ncbi:HCaRG protein [Tritrichomonas foetus]|uniref:COMM domain-containing protein 3 n=1 Tax=Tritrichomonas foetus TaxID=1144522 RepID=A0A1J4KLJ6_9EUKA|nr:HCaRG protein [Tritrichomonas foetus]|eukprot:OHT11816.1 HCaRG protein [Tritrichomonas foetus]